MHRFALVTVNRATEMTHVLPFKTAKRLRLSCLNSLITISRAALLLMVVATVGERAAAGENARETPNSLNEDDVAGAVIWITAEREESETIGPLALQPNGLLGGADMLAPKMSHVPLPGFSSDVRDSSWRVTSRDLIIEWTTHVSQPLPSGNIIVTIKNKLTLNRQDNTDFWVGTVELSLSSNTGQKHEETVPCKAVVSDTAFLERAGEESMKGGVHALQKAKLLDAEYQAQADEMVAHIVRERANLDQVAVTEQVKRVEAAERDARATAAAGVDSREQLGEATRKFEALEKEKSKLTYLKNVASKNNELAELAEAKRKKSWDIFKLAEKRGEQIGKTVGLLGPIGELFEGDRRRQALKAEGKYLSIWVNMFETLGAVAGGTVTSLGNIGGGLNPVGQFLAAFGFEEACRQTGKIIGEATGAWTGLKDAP